MVIPQVKGRPNLKWMRKFLENSNVRFTGAYVTGALPPEAQAGSFCKNASEVSRGWMGAGVVTSLRDQGWGIAFFYNCWSLHIGCKMEWSKVTVDRDLGTLTGHHIRTTMAGLGDAWAGSVVIIDQEDSETTTLPAALIEFYVGIFDEMSRPDDELPAFRPGFYGHGNSVRQVLPRRRDLFIWDVQLDTGKVAFTPLAPFVVADDPIQVDTNTRPVRPYLVDDPASQPPFIVLPLGRQFRWYIGDMPPAGSPTARHWKATTATKEWDFDVSLVQHPAVPEANPRIGVCKRGGRPIVLSGTFAAAGAGGTPPAQSALAVLPIGGVTTPTAGDLVLDAGVIPEPGAPCIAFVRGSDLIAATVLAKGKLGTATLGAQGNWTSVAEIGSKMPVLRGIRAIAGVSRTVPDSMIFMVASDHHVYATSLTANPWDDAVVINTDLRLHPFSRLAVATRGADTVDVFFVDWNGLLGRASWPTGTAWPGFVLSSFETAPSIFPGSAIACAGTGSGNDMLVFAVGQDQRLRFSAFVQGQGWTALDSAGEPQDLLGPHTRLAAHMIDDTHIEVAAISDDGKLAVYPFEKSGAWAPDARTVIEHPAPLQGPPPAPPAGTPLAPADGFRIHPFGDLGIDRPQVGGTTSVICIGLRSSETRPLVCDLGASPSWRYVV